MNLAALHEQIAAVCPIHGVNTDKVISFKAEATPEQRAQAQAIADAAVLDNSPGVPQEVTKRQAMQALILAGLDAQVDEMLAAMPGVEGKMARAEWHESNTVRRDRPLVLQMAQQLGLTEAQLDDLFTTAGGLS